MPTQLYEESDLARARLTSLICDFCSAPGEWRFRAESFNAAAAGTLIGSRGDWITCGACHPLVLAKDWDRLAGRATTCNMQKIGSRFEPGSREWTLVRSEVARFVAGFARAWTGEVSPI